MSFSSGRRVDVMCRCITAALYISNGLRKNTMLWLVLQPTGVTISVSGRSVSGLNPDEKTVALLLQRTLEVDEFNDQKGKCEDALIAKAETAESLLEADLQEHPYGVGAGAGDREMDGGVSFLKGVGGKLTKSDRNLAKKQVRLMSEFAGFCWDLAKTEIRRKGS